MPSVTSIKLRISERLLDKQFREAFFRAQAADGIAISIRELRAKRHKRQKDLAREARMQQSAISRIEQADYGKWTLKTLLKVAAALDARLQISLEPVEEAIVSYKEKEVGALAQEQRVAYRFPDTSGIEISKDNMIETIDKNNLANPFGSHDGG